MSLNGYVRQLKPFTEKYIPPVDKVQTIISEEAKLPKEVFVGLSYEINTRKSSSKRTVITVKSKDRDNDRDEILRAMRQSGIVANTVETSSTIDPIDGNYEGENFRIEVKPASGGMAETTLNSSITELFPCIAFEKNYTPKSPQEFIEWLFTVNLKSLTCVNSKDMDAAQDTVNKADSSSKFEEKMNNAIGVIKYLKDAHRDKPIKNVYWGYRAKPTGVPKNHPGDMFIQYNDNKFLGVSLKAGGKKTAEPQLNTYTTPVFNAFREGNRLRKLRNLVYAQVYSKINGMPPINTFDKKDVRKTQQVLKELDKTNNKQYEAYYDQYLSIMRTGIVDLFNLNKGKSLNYIKQEILRDAPDVPTIVIKAIGSGYEEVTDKDAIGVFLPQVKFVKAYPSSSSKQNWFIELISGNETIKMSMTIRTNKSGHAGVKKLGQFSLAVKYNGIAK